ncbi:phage portal protein, partial [Profundibacter sp.]
MSFPFGIIDRIARPFRRRSGIEAAGGGRRWEGAPVLNQPAHSTIAARQTIEKRAGALYVNNAQAARAVEAWVAALIGPGWNARSQHPDPETARPLNDAFESMIRPHMLLLARCLVRDGEAFMQMIITEDGGLELKPITAEQIDASLTRELGDGRRIVSGIELDAQDRVLAFHIYRDPPG